MRNEGAVEWIREKDSQIEEPAKKRGSTCWYSSKAVKLQRCKKTNTTHKIKAKLRNEGAI